MGEGEVRAARQGARGEGLTDQPGDEWTLLEQQTLDDLPPRPQGAAKQDQVSAVQAGQAKRLLGHMEEPNRAVRGRRICHALGRRLGEWLIRLGIGPELCHRGRRGLGRSGRSLCPGRALSALC